jgi:MFS family permease
MLMTASIISNIISNILAYGIAKIQSANGYHGWRWIFIIEGLLTVAVGAACLWSNISRPEQATFLSEEEKRAINNTVEVRTTTIGLVSEWRVFLSNPLNYIWASLFLLTCSSTYSVSLFAPTFVQTFHPDWQTPAIQGQVIPIFVVSAAASLLFGWAADRLNHRCAFALTGYIFTVSRVIIRLLLTLGITGNTR